MKLVHSQRENHNIFQKSPKLSKKKKRERRKVSVMNNLVMKASLRECKDIDLCFLWVSLGGGGELKSDTKEHFCLFICLSVCQIHYPDSYEQPIICY